MVNFCNSLLRPKPRHVHRNLRLFLSFSWNYLWGIHTRVILSLANTGFQKKYWNKNAVCKDALWSNFFPKTRNISSKSKQTQNYIIKTTDYGSLMKPFFNDIPNLWTWADKLGWSIWDIFGILAPLEKWIWLFFLQKKLWFPGRTHILYPKYDIGCKEFGK